MRKLSSFTFITLNGFYKGMNEDINWHKHGTEEAAFSAENLKTGNALLFGRVTYEMMAAFWPSPVAAENFPVVAEGMNKAEKYVFSKNLQQAKWNNTRIIHKNIIEKVKALKQSDGSNLTLLGSGKILTQFAEANIVDEYLLMIDPVAIGQGVTLFDKIIKFPDLTLKATRVFKSGTILLTYEPAEVKKSNQ